VTTANDDLLTSMLNNMKEELLPMESTGVHVQDPVVSSARTRFALFLCIKCDRGRCRNPFKRERSPVIAPGPVKAIRLLHGKEKRENGGRNGIDETPREAFSAKQENEEEVVSWSRSPCILR
jgi:hypothetical protein